MHYVYILKSQKDQRHYIGYTQNLDKRLEEHNKGKSPSVRNRGPFVLIYKEIFWNKLDAIHREKKIKSFKGGEAFRRLISRSSDPIV